MLSEKKILNETKSHNPPFKLNGRSLNSEDNILHSTHLFYFLKSLYSIPENLHKWQVKPRAKLTLWSEVD